MSNPTLVVKDLCVTRMQKKQAYKILDKVGFSVHQGECLGILGESGSGKSMTVKAIMGLLDRDFMISGEARYKDCNLLGQSEERLRRLRGKEICMVLQNPMTCFDPLYRIGYQMAETFATHTDWDKKEIENRSVEILSKMCIREPLEVLQKYPHQLSGGMLQRITIGIAMVLEPDLLIADEPTTAIDSITQNDILHEFLKIKKTKHTSLIFITHDLGVISHIADNIIVMNSGKVAEEGTFDYILNNASDSYTKLLVEKKMAVMTQYHKIMKQGVNVR